MEALTLIGNINLAKAPVWRAQAGWVPSPLRVKGRDASIFILFPYRNAAHSCPLGCIRAWESPFPQQHLNPLPNLATFRGGAGIAGIRTKRGRRESCHQHSHGKSSHRSLTLYEPREKHQQEANPGKAPGDACSLSPRGDIGHREDPPPCPWQGPCPKPRSPGHPGLPRSQQHRGVWSEGGGTEVGGGVRGTRRGMLRGTGPQEGRGVGVRAGDC